jgi:predicted transcriptional regulator
MPTARELMDEPDFVEHDASIEKLAEEFKGSENTLIVRKNGKAVGEIHENVMLKLLIPEEKLDEEKVVGILGLSFDSSYAPENAEDVMDQHEVDVKPDDGIGDIAFLMNREDVRALPVKEDGEIKGVVHENTLMEYL